MITIGRLQIRAERWPWQEGYGWRGMYAPGSPPQVPPFIMGRFGGGWSYALGFTFSTGKHGGSLNLNLLYGMLCFSYRTLDQVKRDEVEAEERVARRINESVRLAITVQKEHHAAELNRMRAEYEANREVRVALWDALRALRIQVIADVKPEKQGKSLQIVLAATQCLLDKHETPPF